MNYDNDKFLSEFKSIAMRENPCGVLFVCSSEYDRYGYRAALDAVCGNVTAFTAFEPCPEVSSVKNGVEIFKQSKCDFIVTVGGGSAVDTAKAIKYFAGSDVKILAVPTTAGTGAEVTRFAVLYEKGDKSSVSSYDIIPDFQVFDYTVLKSLPKVQKIVTGLDAFTHAAEAYWSKEADDAGRDYSRRALGLFKSSFESYINNDDGSQYENMMKCSELAGRAINAARTTAAHAFSYKLHKLKGFYHGHAVAVCLVYIWEYMLSNPDEKTQLVLKELSDISGFNPLSLKDLITRMGLPVTLTMTSGEFDETVTGVDSSRLANHPVDFSQQDIINIYKSFITVKD